MAPSFIPLQSCGQAELTVCGQRIVVQQLPQLFLRLDAPEDPAANARQQCLSPSEGCKCTTDAATAESGTPLKPSSGPGPGPGPLPICGHAAAGCKFIPSLPCLVLSCMPSVSLSLPLSLFLCDALSLSRSFLYQPPPPPLPHAYTHTKHRQSAYTSPSHDFFFSHAFAPQGSPHVH